MKALGNLWSGLEYLVRDFILTTADRIDFYEFNDEWSELKEYPDSTAEIILKDNFFYLGKSEKPYSIAYPIFAISEHVTNIQFNIPFVRLIDEKGFMEPQGTLILDRAMQAHFKGCVQLIQELSKNSVISEVELTLFCDRLERYGYYNSEQFQKISEIRKDLKLPERDNFSTISNATGSATTNAKAIKNIINYIASNDLTIIQKVDLLLKLRGLLGALEGKKINNLIPYLKKLNPIFLNHSHPMVRDLYLVCINQVVRLLFYYNLKGREVECLNYLEILVKQRINPDINLAQKSVLEYHLKNDNAENTWNELLQITKKTKYQLPLIDSWYDALNVNEWKKHALTRIMH